MIEILVGIVLIGLGLYFGVVGLVGWVIGMASNHRGTSVFSGIVFFLSVAAIMGGWRIFHAVRIVVYHHGY